MLNVCSNGLWSTSCRNLSLHPPPPPAAASLFLYVLTPLHIILSHRILHAPAPLLSVSHALALRSSVSACASHLPLRLPHPLLLRCELLIPRSLRSLLINVCLCYTSFPSHPFAQKLCISSPVDLSPLAIPILSPDRPSVLSHVSLSAPYFLPFIIPLWPPLSDQCILPLPFYDHAIFQFNYFRAPCCPHYSAPSLILLPTLAFLFPVHQHFSINLAHTV